MEWYGFAAVMLIGAGFCVCSRIPAFLVWAAAVVAAFVFVTVRSVGDAAVPAWIVMTAGLLAWTLGFAIVRLMLVRSVSLQLLRRIGRQRGDAFHVQIRERIDDLYRARLARRVDGRVVLTPFGRWAAAVVAVLYRAVRTEV